MFTQEDLAAIAALPANAYKFKAHIDSLLALYAWVREQWTAAAVKNLCHEQGLDLRRKDDRAVFAWFAAQELVKALPPAPEVPQPAPSVTHHAEPPAPDVTHHAETPAPVDEHEADGKTIRILVNALALLPPVPPTNGLESAPAYQILGSPIYADELRRNYQALVQKWHPDLNPSVEAVGRFQVINEIYQGFRAHWFDKYSPLIPIDRLGRENVLRAMEKTFPWTPESFWV